MSAIGGKADISQRGPQCNFGIPVMLLQWPLTWVNREAPIWNDIISSKKGTSLVTHIQSGTAHAIEAIERAVSKSFYRVLNAIEDSNAHYTERQIVRFIGGPEGKFTDECERKIGRFLQGR